MEAEQKLDTLRAIVRNLGSALVAFSGGVDSSLLLKVCREELGDRALAVTAASETYPAHELEEAKQIAQLIGARHLVVQTSEINIEGFSRNPPDRCYYCKRELFSKLWSLAKDRGLACVLDGSNADDTHDYRPGARAARELNVRSPLREAGLTKDDIRKISHDMHLPTWNKPAYACLASRFPYGQQITVDKLQAVGRAEELLRGMGFSGLRVRHHGRVARIELSQNDLVRAVQPAVREQIVSGLKGLGFAYVSLDLEGYRTGSMNEILAE